MLIDNKLLKMVGVPMQKAPAKAGEDIPYLSFRPGINRVTDAEWAAFKEHDAGKFYLKKNQIQALETSGKDNFLSIKDEEAIAALVDRVADADLLSEMMEQDKRKDFQKAAKKQLKRLALPDAE